jgi:hypothetical protein
MKYSSLQQRLQKLSKRHSSGFMVECICVSTGEVQKIEIPCRLWKGYSQTDGYVTPGKGYGKINLTKNGRSLKHSVHRVSKILAELLHLEPAFDFYNEANKQLFFDLYEAYLRADLSVDHLCKKTLCIEPTHLEWVHLTANQKRKKWNHSKRQKRFGQIASHATRHAKAVQVSASVQEFINKIRRKRYRII